MSFKKIDVFLNRFLAFNSFGFYQVNKGLVCSFEILPSKKKIPLKLSFRIKITNKLFKKKKLCYETRKKFTGRDKFSIENEKSLTGVIKYVDNTNSFKVNEKIGFTPFSEYEFVIEGERLYRVINKEISIRYGFKETEREYNPSWL